MGCCKSQPVERETQQYYKLFAYRRTMRLVDAGLDVPPSPCNGVVHVIFGDGTDVCDRGVPSAMRGTRERLELEREAAADDDATAARGSEATEAPDHLPQCSPIMGAHGSTQSPPTRSESAGSSGPRWRPPPIGLPKQDGQNGLEDSHEPFGTPTLAAMSDPQAQPSQQARQPGGHEPASTASVNHLSAPAGDISVSIPATPQIPAGASGHPAASAAHNNSSLMGIREASWATAAGQSPCAAPVGGSSLSPPPSLSLPPASGPHDRNHRPSGSQALPPVDADTSPSSTGLQLPSANTAGTPGATPMMPLAASDESPGKTGSLGRTPYPAPELSPLSIGKPAADRGSSAATATAVTAKPAPGSPSPKRAATTTAARGSAAPRHVHFEQSIEATPAASAKHVPMVKSRRKRTNNRSPNVTPGPVRAPQPTLSDMGMHGSFAAPARDSPPPFIATGTPF